VPPSEFDLIDRYFRQSTENRPDVSLGIGDDCALLTVPAHRQLAVTMDTLVEGVHFFPHADPFALGHKALAVNLSDLAAMGAEPVWVTLALTLPEANELWLEGFAAGFLDLAAAHRVALVGGDTTRGPLSITVQAHGLVEPGRALRRDGAASGDLVYVTGTLGDAALAVRRRQGVVQMDGPSQGLDRRLDRPEPRVAAGRAFAGLASAAIDLSDGLLSDLGHILKASACGATLGRHRLPLSRVVRDYVEATGDWRDPLAGGDDYELCLCVPAARRAEAESVGERLDCGLTLIGQVEVEKGLRVLDEDGRVLETPSTGYDHFAGAEG